MDHHALDQARTGYAENNGVKIHYKCLGEGPLVVMVHGFPDFWYSWCHQMQGLADRFRVAALDQRGYNKSDKPAGRENYDAAHLVGDVAAVIHAEGAQSATVVGHDWGGYVAWNLAIFRPELVERLVVMNLPHPQGLARELAHNPEQQQNSAYARAFQREGAHKLLNPELLSSYVTKDAETAAKYREAFENSDFEAMLHYYKQNYPRPPYEELSKPLPQVQCPVLLFHGLKDKALHRNALAGTWDWVANELSIVTLPAADHWAHHDEAATVTAILRDWLVRHASQG